MGFTKARARAVFDIVFIISCIALQAAQAAQSNSFQWGIKVIDHTENPDYNGDGRSAMAPYTEYIACVYTEEKATELPNKNFAYQLHGSEMDPSVSYVPENIIEVLSAEFTFVSGMWCWDIRSTTPEVITATITSSTIGAARSASSTDEVQQGRLHPGFSRLTMEDRDIVLRTSSVLYKDYSTGNYSILLGENVDSIPVSVIPNKVAYTSDLKASADSALIFDADSNYVRYSHDGFDESYSSLIFMNDALFCVGGVVDPCTPLGVKQVVFAAERVLVRTSTSVVQGQRERIPQRPSHIGVYEAWEPTIEELKAGWHRNMSWSTAIDMEVDFVALPTQHSPFITAFDNQVFAGARDPVALFYSFDVSSPFEELVTSDGDGVEAVWGVAHGWNATGARALSACSCLERADTVLLLVDTGAAQGRYRLYGFEGDVLSGTHVGTWNFKFAFMDHVPDDVPTYYPLVSDYYTLKTGFTPMNLTLNSMVFSSSISEDLLVWGNALLYSQDGGDTFFVLQSYPGDNIVEVAISSWGSYVALTESKVLWFGQFGHFILVPLTLPHDAFSQIVPAQLQFWTAYFDEENHLHILGMPYNNTDAVVYQSRPLQGYVQDKVDRYVQVTSSLCPYEFLDFEASLEREFTRSNDYNTEASLPSHIFLNHHEQYTVNLSIGTADFARSTTDDIVSVYVLGSEIDVSVTQTTVSSDGKRREYRLDVRDLGTHDGDGHALNSVRVIIANTSYACHDHTRLLPDNQITSVSVYDLVVYSGCSPGEYITYNAPASKYGLEVCKPTAEAECASYAWDYSPRLNITDTVAGTNQNYGGLFYFTIIGGGPTPSEMRAYSQSEIDSFNGGSATIYSVIGTTNGALDSGSSVVWMCSWGSPCATVLPVWPNAPEYFFRVRVSTEGLDDSTYCTYTTEYTLRLYAVAMHWTLMLTIVGISLASLIGLTLFAYIFLRPTYVQYHLDMQESLEDAEEERSAAGNSKHLPAKPRSGRMSNKSSKSNKSNRMSQGTTRMISRAANKTFLSNG